MYIRVNDADNVGIIVEPEGFVSPRERIPQAHKMALCDIEEGAPITRYGQTIGTANRAIAAGSWVREELMDMPAAPPLDELPLATAVPAKLPPLEGYTFEGYRIRMVKREPYNPRREVEAPKSVANPPAAAPANEPPLITRLKDRVKRLFH